MIFRKNKAGFFLLFSMVIPVIFFMSFIGYQEFIRWQMEEKLEHEQLTTITVNSADFKWHKEGKEIIVNGHLFDVKTIEKLNDYMLTITGLYDYQEQQLHESISKLLHKNSNNNMLKLIQQMFAFVATEPINRYQISSLSFVTSPPEEFYDRSLRSSFCLIIIPPPKIG